MQNRNLSAIIEDRIEDMKSEWFKEVKNSEFMKTYNSFSDEEIVKRGEAVFTHLRDWLNERATNAEVEKYFENVGAQRFNEHFPLTEVQYALSITKKIFWNHVDWRDKITGAFESSNATQIMNIFNNYFDLGNFYITRGYFQAIIFNLKDDKKFSKDDLQRLFMKGDFNPEETDEEEFIWRPI